MAKSTRQLPEAPTDEDLGIDEPDDAAPAGVSNDQFLAFLQDPRLAGVIDAAVAARMAQLTGAAPGAPLPAPAVGGGASEIVAGIERLIEMNRQQMPGYQKPVSADEMERRAQGFVDMNALLDQYRGQGAHMKPSYRLLENLFAGEVEYKAESSIATWMYPNEQMTPLNDPARQVHEAMLRWIGGSQPDIAVRVYEAELETRERVDSASPFIKPRSGNEGFVELLEGPPDTSQGSLGRPKALSEMPVHQV